MKYTCIKQHDQKDCGVACLSSICTHYGLKLPLVRYKELTKSDNMGTNVLGLVDAGNVLGFECEALTGDYTELLSEIKNIKLPFIAHVVREGQFEHFVVVYEISHDKLVIADPATGIEKKTAEDFKREWTGTIITYKKTERFKKDNQKENLVTFFLNNISNKGKLISVILLFTILASLLGIVTSITYSLLIDGVVLGNFDTVSGNIFEQFALLDPSQLILLVLISGIGFQLLKLLFDILKGTLVAKLSLMLDNEIIENYYNQLVNLPIDFFGTKKTGELISRFNDAVKIRSAMMSVIVSVTLDFVMVLIGGYLMFQISPKLFILTLIVAGIFLIIVYLFKNKIEEFEKKIMFYGGIVTSFLKESITGIETIKILNLEQSIDHSFKKMWKTNQQAIYKASIVDNARFSLVEFISSVGLICIYALGTKEILFNEMSIGILISFSTLSGYFLSPFTNIVNLQTEIQSANVALNRLGDVIYAKQENKADGKQAIDFNKDIYMKNVSFRYGNRALTLNKINFKARKGEITSIIGESGSGKTSLVKLIMKLVDKESGDILIGSEKIENISAKKLRQKIAVVSQTSFFFNESVLENLKKASPSLTEKDIVSLCKSYCIDKMIQKLPMGYETILEEGGNNLSGGQKQLLNIARALLRKPEILILDEATSNLDSLTEATINDLIFSLNITCIIVAHRLRTVINSDQIILLENGRVIDSGTHKELLVSSSQYRHMLEKQMLVS